MDIRRLADRITRADFVRCRAAPDSVLIQTLYPTEVGKLTAQEMTALAQAIRARFSDTYQPSPARSENPPISRRRADESSQRYLGREEMQALTLSVMGSLERAGLTDMLEEVQRRIFQKAPEEVCEASAAAPGTTHLRFKPMVELVLYEVRDLARMPHLNSDGRRQRIIWTLNMAGL